MTDQPAVEMSRPPIREEIGPHPPLGDDGWYTLIPGRSETVWGMIPELMVLAAVVLLGFSAGFWVLRQSMADHYLSTADPIGAGELMVSQITGVLGAVSLILAMLVSSASPIGGHWRLAVERHPLKLGTTIRGMLVRQAPLSPRTFRLQLDLEMVERERSYWFRDRPMMITKRVVQTVVADIRASASSIDRVLWQGDIVIPLSAKPSFELLDTQREWALVVRIDEQQVRYLIRIAPPQAPDDSDVDTA